MKPAALERLIEKFYAGETTLEEEEQLRFFFKQDDVPEQYRELKEQFSLMDNLGHEELPVDFEKRLLAQMPVGSNGHKSRIGQYWIPAIAATLLILITIIFGTDLLKPKKVYGTISDPEIAFMETRKVLEDVSGNINKGLVPAKETVEKVETNVQKAAAINEMNKALEKAKDIHKLENASELL
ncbi:MAG: hypothetical protein P8100_08945, partial [bacterium]